jgi:ketosteroid isomerase-like protein
MEIKQLKAVMLKYKRAWEERNTNLILECFTKSGVYQESPLAKPYLGHKGIAKFWDKVVVSETRNIKFTLGKCYVSADKKTGFAEWKCTNIQREKHYRMTGIMILKMKGDKITFLNEYWNSRKW